MSRGARENGRSRRYFSTLQHELIKAEAEFRGGGCSERKKKLEPCFQNSGNVGSCS